MQADLFLFSNKRRAELVFSRLSFVVQKSRVGDTFTVLLPPEFIVETGERLVKNENPVIQ